METMEYNKRPGTSAHGHFYETKLISLILFRLLHNKYIEQFYLASNYDGIGPFDDICFKAKITGRVRPILVFIQAKHKENDDARLEFDLIKHSYDSFIKVKERFSKKNSKAKSRYYDLFSGKFSDNDCVFILYTNAVYHLDICDQVVSYKRDILLNDLLRTGDKDSQAFPVEHIHEHAQILNEKLLKEEVATVAEHFTKFLNDKSINIMLDPCILQYHVILAQHVVDISKIKFKEVEPHDHEYRLLKFRPNFFDTDDTILVMLKEKIFKLVMRKNGQVNTNIIRLDAPLLNVPSTDVSTTHDVGNSSPSIVTNLNESTIEQQISLFLSEPSATKLSPLIGTHIIYENNQLKFIGERPSSELQKLKEVNISASLIEESKAIAARNILSSLILKVPVTFGNIDLTVKDKERLEYLTTEIDRLCERAESTDSYKLVTVEKDKKAGLYSVNGGIGGAVGNLLVHDEATKYLKFTENRESLENSARCLFDMLTLKREHLDMYRFDFKDIANFPKSVFVRNEEVKEILSNVLVFQKQENHEGVEKLLKDEIAIHQKLLYYKDLDTSELIKNNIFLHYHNKVLDWWMDKKGIFLTNTMKYYEETVKNIDIEPQMSKMHNTFCVYNMEYLQYDFTKDALGSLESLGDHATNIVLTDVTILTMIKVIRWLKDNNNTYSVVDLKRIPSPDIPLLINELRRTEKVLIVLCDSTDNSCDAFRILGDRAIVTKTIVVTNKKFDQTAEGTNVIDEENRSITDLTPESQDGVLTKANVLFQGDKVSLKDILTTDESVAFIKGVMLNKILCNEPVIIGKPLKYDRNSKMYEEVKKNYIKRKLSRPPNVNDHAVESFYDIDAEVVLLTSTAGMGKSTLLSHLIHNTKEYDKSLWIIKINLLDHTDKFRRWQQNKLVMDSLTALNFIFQVTFKYHTNNEIMKARVETADGNLYRVIYNKNDVEALFEYHVFQHCYNTRQLLFLFDGFDEICPNYKDQILDLCKVIKEYFHKKKLWVTSRPYNEILPDLEKNFGESYVLQHVTADEQEIYVNKYWQIRIPVECLNDEQRYSMITVLQQHIQSSTYIASDIFFFLMKFLMSQTNDTTPEELARIKRLDTVDTFLGTPLFLFLFSDYAANLVIRCDPHQLIRNFDVFSNYEYFIKAKLAMSFKNKHGAKISNPLFEGVYKYSYQKCIKMYKKIGAYAILQRSIFHDNCHLAEFEEYLIEIKTLITNYKRDEDSTGLISAITSDNVPIFIHDTFAEYFASEFICDMLKSNVDTFTKQLLYSAILLYHQVMITYWLRGKRNIDKELDRIITNDIDSKQSICELIPPSVFSLPFSGWSFEQNIRIHNSTLDDYDTDMAPFLNSWLKPGSQKATFIDDFVARMKPHLKQYFPEAPSHPKLNY